MSNKPAQLLPAAAMAAALLFFNAPLSAADEKLPEPSVKAEKTTEKPAEKLPEIVAVVDGHEIKLSELEKNIDTALAHGGATAESLPAGQKLAAYNSALEEMITDYIVSEKAGKIEVSDAEVNEQIKKISAQFPSEEALEAEVKKSGETMEGLRKELRQSIQQQKWIETLSSDKKVDEAVAEDFYKKNPQHFKAPEMVRASHILVTVPADAKPEAVAEKEKQTKAIAERVNKGDDFAKVASEVSEDPGTKEKGGDLSFFTRDHMVPEFAEAAFKLEPGKLSDPVKTQFGFHLIKVTEKKPARTIPFDEAKPRIMTFLQEQQRRETVNSAIETARKEAKVTIHLPKPPEQPAPAPGGQ